MTPSLTLSLLAELAPTGQEQVLDVLSGRSPLWVTDPDWPQPGPAAERLAAADVLHRHERILRRGWVWLWGRVEIDGVRRRVRTPLLTEPVRLRRVARGYRVEPAGDLEVTPLVTDPEVAARLEEAAGGDLASWLRGPDVAEWITQAAEAAGFPVSTVVDTGGAKLPEDTLVGVAAAALYPVRDVFGFGLRDTLVRWSRQPGLEHTALAAVYGFAPRRPDIEAVPAPAADEVLSPLPLTPAQAEVVRRARHEPVTVVSGPPGNGKSHTVVAAALEVVDRGGSVLVATQSHHAAEVLGELLERYPGPTPVRFGDAESRDTVAATLIGGAGRGLDPAIVRAAEAAVDAARARVRQLTDAVAAALGLEARAAEAAMWGPLVPALAAEVPGAFAPTTDLDAVWASVLQAERPGEGWWARRRRHRAGRRARARLGASPTVAWERLRAALAAGQATRAWAQLTAAGGTDLGHTWTALAEAEAALAAAVGEAMRVRANSTERWSVAARLSAARLATALRAGRRRRRQMLAELDGAAIRSFPLWIGTVADVEDLLPAVPGLFDLVILDEASHIDQIRAAPVLARARRAMVVGDPRQLRFVSFVADVDVTEALRRYRLDDRADVRRVSAYDLAAGAAPVVWLDEHFRSVPHLIEFSARRFYRIAGVEALTVATRHPRNEARDVIDVVRVRERGLRQGVNQAEVAAAVDTVRRLAADGVTSIGVISPFRAQADAIESAIVAALPVDELERLAVRVGTVHAFQGSEAHTVVVSLGLTDDDSPSRVRFVTDPQLFNVMVTRARERIVVITSLSDPDGLIGEYLAHGDAGPRPPTGSTPAGWAAALAAEFRAIGVPVRADYPVGRWRVDLCVGEGAEAVGLNCVVHPDGIAASLARQRALTRAGWRLIDAYPSRWGGDPVRAALDLSARLAIVTRH